MRQNISKSVATYSRIIKQVDNKVIIHHLHNQLKTAKLKNNEIDSVIQLFSKDSKIGKALKQD